MNLLNNFIFVDFSFSLCTDINIIDSKTVSVQFTQVESLEFTIDKKIEAQLNWIFIDSGITRRAATKVKIIELDKQLLKEVIQ